MDLLVCRFADSGDGSHLHLFLQRLRPVCWGHVGASNNHCRMDHPQVFYKLLSQKLCENDQQQALRSNCKGGDFQKQRTAYE